MAQIAAGGESPAQYGQKRTKDPIMATTVIGAHTLEHMYGRGVPGANPGNLRGVGAEPDPGRAAGRREAAGWRRHQHDRRVLRGHFSAPSSAGADPQSRSHRRRVLAGLDSTQLRPDPGGPGDCVGGHGDVASAGAGSAGAALPRTAGAVHLHAPVYWATWATGSAP